MIYNLVTKGKCLIINHLEVKKMNLLKVVHLLIRRMILDNIQRNLGIITIKKVYLIKEMKKTG